jgi:glutaredoxin-like protein
MPIIQEKDQEKVRSRFESLSGPVTVVNFTQSFECDFCRETRQLVEEVSVLSDKIKVEVYDFAEDRDMVEKYQIDKIPATVVVGEKDYGIRFCGIPSGYEFVSLLQAVEMVSRGDSGLLQESRDLLAQLKKPVHLQVFVTPT